jgi:hypothetical protein
MLNAEKTSPRAKFLLPMPPFQIFHQIGPKNDDFGRNFASFCEISVNAARQHFKLEKRRAPWGPQKVFPRIIIAELHQLDKSR